MSLHGADVPSGIENTGGPTDKSLDHRYFYLKLGSEQ